MFHRIGRTETRAESHSEFLSLQDATTIMCSQSIQQIQINDMIKRFL